MFFVCAILFVLFERPFMKRHWPTDVLIALGITPNRLKAPQTPQSNRQDPQVAPPAPGDVRG
jgi:hypothetical protein